MGSLGELTFTLVYSYYNEVLNGLADSDDGGAMGLWHSLVQVSGVFVCFVYFSWGWNPGICCLQKDQEETP